MRPGLHEHSAGRRNQPHPAQDPGRPAPGDAGTRSHRLGQNLSAAEPFFTIATQNPIEQEGTYPLPEAQLDRFMFNVKVDLPQAGEEERILTVTTTGERAEVKKVLSAKSILYLQADQSDRGRPADRQLCGSAGTGNSTQRWLGPGLHQGDGRLGSRSPCGSVPDPRSPRDRRDGRTGGCVVRRCAPRRDPGAEARIAANFQAQAEGASSDDIVTRLVRRFRTQSAQVRVVRHDHTKSVKGRRSLRFEQLADIVRDAEEISAGQITCLGNWSAGQVFSHCAQTMNCFLDGHDFGKVSFLGRFVGWLIKDGC